MISVSDILKLLEQIPIWKTISHLPKRVAELEQRVAKLEAAAALPKSTSIPEARVCPLCGEVMKITKEEGHIHFGDMGLKTHHMKCPGCNNETTRDYEPGKGYM